MSYEEAYGETKSYERRFYSSHKALEAIEKVMKASSVDKKFGYLIWLKSSKDAAMEEDDVPSLTIPLSQIEELILARTGKEDIDDTGSEDDAEQREKLNPEELKKLKRKERQAAKSLKGSKLILAGASVIAATARAVKQNINRGVYQIGSQRGTY
jgi:hypothetical protein